MKKIFLSILLIILANTIYASYYVKDYTINDEQLVLTLVDTKNLSAGKTTKVIYNLSDTKEKSILINNLIISAVNLNLLIDIPNAVDNKDGSFTAYEFKITNTQFRLLQDKAAAEYSNQTDQSTSRSNTYSSDTY
ncbi:MAG: hypothetical protein GY756_00235 [bacterium]|nr:hypothetical protein [bacterium]